MLRETNQIESDSLRENLNYVTVQVGSVPVVLIQNLNTDKETLPPDYSGADRVIQMSDDGKDHVFITLTPFYQNSTQTRWQRMTQSPDLQKKLEAVDCFALLYPNESSDWQELQKTVRALMMNDFPKVNYGRKGR